MVARLTCNERAGGSSPSGGLKIHTAISEDQDYLSQNNSKGSNPLSVSCFYLGRYTVSSGGTRVIVV